MVLIIRSHVNFPARDADGGDALLRADEMLTSEAAIAGNCSLQAVRKRIKKFGIGHWDARLRMFVVDGAKLAAHLEKRRQRQKRLP
jgi:hypothetical protein